MPESHHKTIYRRKLKGEKLRVIAGDYGVGRERIRQLVRVYAHKKGLRLPGSNEKPTK